MCALSRSERWRSLDDTSEAARAALLVGRVRAFALRVRAARSGRVARAAAVAGAPVATELEEVVHLLQREHILLNRRPDRVGQYGRDGVGRAPPRALPERSAVRCVLQRARLGDRCVLTNARRTRPEAAVRAAAAGAQCGKRRRERRAGDAGTAGHCLRATGKRGGAAVFRRVEAHGGFVMPPALRAAAPAAAAGRLHAAVRVVNPLVQSGRQLWRKARLSEERRERFRHVVVLLRGHCAAQNQSVRCFYVLSVQCASPQLRPSSTLRE